MMERFRGFLLNKRAVTPVLSNILLMAVAVAAMSIATTATYVITNNLRETMSERVVIEDVWFEGDGIHVYLRNIHVYLRNVGKVAVEVSAVYINNTPQYFRPQSFSLEVDEHGWLNISYSWTADSVYHINIVTKRGIHIEDSYKAP